MQHSVTTAMLGAFRSFQILYREELMYSEVKDDNREEIFAKLTERWDQENGDERVLSFFSRFGVHKFGISTNWPIHSCSQSLVGIPYISGIIVPGSRESYWTRDSKINLSPSFPLSSFLTSLHPSLSSFLLLFCFMTGSPYVAQAVLKLDILLPLLLNY